MSSRQNEEDLELAERRVGSTLLEKWTLTRLIGVGGMAAVYEAKHRLGRRAAIKMLHPEVALDGEMKRRFEREALAVAKIDHPGVVAVSDIEKAEDGTPFLVMELLEGASLSEKLGHDGTLPADEALRIGIALCDVLEAAHAHDIIHRDIKPANLFVEPSGRLRVLDFGVARWREGPGGLITAAGTVLGTAAYMAPEQLKGAPVDVRADVFAAGATLFRALAGRHVHITAANPDSKVRGEVERADRELVTAMLTKAAPRLHAVKPEVPEGLCQIIDRALAFQRSRRYPDAATMRTDLRAVERGEAPPFASARLAAGDEPDDLSSSPIDSADTLLAPKVVGASAAREATGDAAEEGKRDEARPGRGTKTALADTDPAANGATDGAGDAKPGGERDASAAVVGDADTEGDAHAGGADAGAEGDANAPEKGSGGTLKIPESKAAAVRAKPARTQVDAEPDAEAEAESASAALTRPRTKKAPGLTVSNERTTVREKTKVGKDGPRSVSDEPTRKRAAAAPAGATRVGKTLPAGEAPGEEHATPGAAAAMQADGATGEDGGEEERLRGRYATGAEPRGTGIGRLVLYVLAFAGVGFGLWWFSRTPSGPTPGSTSSSASRAGTTTGGEGTSAAPAPSATTSTSSSAPASASASASASTSASASASSHASVAVTVPGTAPPTTTTPGPIILPSSFPSLPSSWATVFPSGLPTLFPPKTAPSTTAPPTTTAPKTPTK